MVPPEDPHKLRHRCGPVQVGQLDALDGPAAVQLGQIGPKPLGPRLVAAVACDQQDPLVAQVADQERQQVAGRAVRPVQVLQNQHQRALLAQAPEQAEQHLEQASLGSLAWRAGGLRLPQGGQQPGQLGPGGAGQLAHAPGAQLGEQDPQRLHHRRKGQATFTDWHTPAAQHARSIGAAAPDQLGDQARLAHAGLAPQQDDSRLAVRRPHPGHLKSAQLLDAADKGRAGHAAAHLAPIIASFRAEGNRRVSGRRPQMGRWTRHNLRRMPDSRRPPVPHPRQQPAAPHRRRRILLHKSLVQTACGHARWPTRSTVLNASLTRFEFDQFSTVVSVTEVAVNNKIDASTLS